MFAWRPFLGLFHSVLLHLPIGGLALTFVLDIYAIRRPSREARQLVTAALAFSVASAVVVAVLGQWRSTAGGYDPTALTRHMLAGFGVIVLGAGTLIAQRVAFAHGAGVIPHAIYRGLLLVVMANLVVAGHFGGSLAHGPRYLVENSPPAIKWLLMPGDSLAASEEGGPETMFATRIEPILESRCYRCHGPNKQDSDLRLDDRDLALAGGRTGPAIVPGDPMKSEMMRRLLLPSSAPGAMPPLGSARPTADDVVAIAHWIQEGAPF